MASARIVVVTGAGGFVGVPLVELLLASGTEVRAAVRRESAALARLAARGRLRQVVVGDIAAAANWPGAWPAALEGAGAVVHLAARVHAPRASSGGEAAAFTATNSDATLRLAQAAARAGVERIVFLSSAKAGLDAHDAYAVSKSEAERALREASRGLGIECTIVRSPLVYGPGVRANFLRLMRLVDTGMPLPFASIANRRSLVYVGNLVDALRACGDDARAAGRTFDVSDGEDVSTPELARRIARALGRRARLFPLPVPLLAFAGRVAGRAAAMERLTGDLCVDATAIRETLGWRAPFRMQQGLRETALWFRSARSAR